MEQFTVLDGLVAPIDRANVDTDAIIPKQYLKAIGRTGFGATLFDEWRYHDPGAPGMDHSKRRLRADFVLNQARYAGAQILLARENFGCGSSREHAVWALHEYGFRAVIAPSFAPIFYNNCVRNGIAPVRLAAAEVAALATAVAGDPASQLLHIDLGAQTVRGPDGRLYPFDIDGEAKEMLLEGLDAIDLTLRQRPALDAWLAADRRARPWIYFAKEGTAV